MRYRLPLLVGLVALVTACHTSEPSVVGRWERVGQPKEWLEFRKDGTAIGMSYAREYFDERDTVRATFVEEGSKVTVTANYTATFELNGNELTMQDGTKYRRVRSPLN